ncbi:30S ribosome-binding factor RbfA [Halanaerobacter jeridensis]|uniref:Ribosome-binding factor A n=1 Tax=Halanaerobacter jeridensis TaxID=706427 RepID=A0A938XNG2_9FIRM|nr:30S ribosome-binding factor RbfA [Halanaerobacter jeridensis]MBM7555387.1 ribosome-binding factor A [Halanaerobacter jeridensis]
MVNHRPERVAELIREEVSQLLRREVKDPRIGNFVSVTDVEVSGDLRHAKVFVSTINDNEEELMEGLKSTRGFIRKEIGNRIRLYHTPEIIFRYDDSIERGARIFEIIEDLNEDEENEQE